MARQPKKQHPPVKYRPPEDVAGIVDELVRRFVTEEDRAPGHHCGELCQHRSTLPLLTRIRALVPAGTGVPKENPGKRPSKQLGSPAPWSARPAELLDEIQRGALDLSSQARLVLDLGPLTVPYVVTPVPAVEGPVHPQCDHPSCVAARPRTVRVLAELDPVRGGRAALLDLVRVALPLLRKRDDLHHLADGDRVGEPGEIERQLRRWHQAALLLTGHAVPWPRLGEIPNPDTARTAGPAHERCRHESCIRIRFGRPKPWIQARCPYCSSPSLRQNPETQAIVCTRPSCRDANGRPHQWSADELRRLGLILEATS